MPGRQRPTGQRDPSHASAEGGRIRVRFAPSPTGYLHIGGARSALFNYLFARHEGGVFVLRIEDTDQRRSTAEAVQAILDGLRYLGLDWDEGPEVGGGRAPYFQSQRAESHARAVGDLLASGVAYHCFCARERLEDLRRRQREAKAPVQYDRACLTLDPAEVERRLAGGDEAVVRFRVPPGETVIDDLVRGSVTFRHQDVEDFIVRRADGSAVYNLAVVADDHNMGITHVIRGEDHLTNTPKQILLFRALGWSVPRYAHIPLILGPGGAKLSKRHGAVSVTEYRDQGYLPEAMVNFLARIGWSYDDREELFTMADLIEKFSLGGVSKAGGVYDLDKLNHLGGHYIRERSVEDLVDLTLPFLESSGLLSRDERDAPALRRRLWKIVALEQPRISRLGEIPQRVRYYFEDPEEPDAGGWKALRKKRDARPVVERYAVALDENFAGGWGLDDHASLERHCRSFVESAAVRLGDVAQPARVLLTGRSATPGLFEIMAILGKEACLRRLSRADAWFSRAD